MPVIIVSGSIGEAIAVAAMKSGAHDYIMKDNLARLVPAVDRELREADNRRAHSNVFTGGEMVLAYNTLTTVTGGAR